MNEIHEFKNCENEYVFNNIPIGKLICGMSLLRL